MFKKILVANRGEIAVRIIRACRESGIKSVAVFSEADTKCLHLKLADEQICIGPPLSAGSYLNIESIIAAARQTGADAIHPGYGYLAENEAFAVQCADNDIVFIGPSVANLKLAGDKISAKEKMTAAGVPVVPSSEGGVTDINQALKVCRQIGYPVMIKAAGGGGGRGIRVCGEEQCSGRVSDCAGRGWSVLWQQRSLYRKIHHCTAPYRISDTWGSQQVASSIWGNGNARSSVVFRN